MNLLQQLELEQMRDLSADKTIPDFAPGDTVRVMVKVVEGTRERLQAFEGVVIAKKNRGLNSSFTVRKISFGEGVERVFPLFSPIVAEIKLVRRGRVRRAKLYYLRDRRGKSARIAERTDSRGKTKQPQHLIAQLKDDEMTVAPVAGLDEEAVETPVNDPAMEAVVEQPLDETGAPITENQTGEEIGDGAQAQTEDPLGGDEASANKPIKE